MDVLARIFGGSTYAGTPGPTDDYWYAPVGTMSQAGIRVDTEGARKISAWYRGRDLLATALAMLPLQLYQRLADDKGADVARQHPLYDVVHRKPNGWQNSFEWRRQKMFHLIDHGNGYDWLIEGARGFAHELRPIHPTLVTPKQIKSGPNKGRVLYEVRDEVTRLTTTHTQDEIFHLRGASDDGVVGKGVLEYARDNLGTAMATESYAARIFSHGALNGGIIENPGVLDDDASKRMAQTFKTAVGDWHMPKVLEQGSKWVAQAGITPEEAQMLLSRKFSINDIARWLGLPPHMLADLDRATFSNIEHQGQEFVTYSLGPWLSLWEFAINDQLILAPDKYFAEFTRDALVRGDIAARWAAYQIAVQTGTFTRNEIRRWENANALPGLDEPLDPAHLTGNKADTQPPAKKKAAPAPPEDEDDTEQDDDQAVAFVTRARAITTESAARVLRKEIAAAQKAAVKHADDPETFAAWATEFYDKHVALVSQTLLIGETVARFYCEDQRDQLIACGLTVTEAWSPDYLAGLALDRPRPSALELMASVALAQADQPHDVTVHASPVSIGDGAVRVETPVHVSAPAVHVAPAEVTIAKGAVHLEAPVTVQHPKRTKKTLVRGPDHQVTGSLEEHE